MFSSGGLTGTRLRGRLSPKIFESLQILKSGYWNGRIGIAEQAKARYKAVAEVLEVLDNDDNDDIIEI